MGCQGLGNGYSNVYQSPHKDRSTDVCVSDGLAPPPDYVLISCD